MEAWLLVDKDGKPHYQAVDDPTIYREKYTLFNVEYEHPNGVGCDGKNLISIEEVSALCVERKSNER